MAMKTEREQGAGGNVIELLRQVARQPPPVTIARRQPFLFSLSLSLISYLLSRYYDEILRLKIEKK